MTFWGEDDVIAVSKGDDTDPFTGEKYVHYSLLVKGTKRLTDAQIATIIEVIKHGKNPVCLVEDAPIIDAVPIKDISEWLAGYTAPPKYALEMFPESERCLANTLAAAWEHHISTMTEYGLMPLMRINEKKEE